MQVFAQLSKVDVEKRLVYGRAAQEVPDHSGEVMDYEQSKPHFEKWSDDMSKATNGASMGNIRAMHGNVAAGKVQELIYNDEEHAIDVVAKVVDDNEWEKVLEGVYTGFSIGGKYGARVTKGDLRYYEAIPSEISLVDRPCIPTATFFDIQKADGSVMQKQFKGAADMADDIEYTVEGTPEQADALAKMLHENNLTIGDAVAAIEKSIAPVDVNVAAMVELSKRYSVEETNEMEAEYIGSLLALEKVAARADVSPKEGEGKYGNVKFADEKNNKYPIDNEAHIRAAWNYINKESNAGKYSDKDLASIKANIVAAWKDKIDKAGPPAAAEKAEQTGELAKGLYDTARLAELLQGVYYSAMACKEEATREMDNSDIPARLAEVVSTLAVIYKDMAAEEADELVEELGENEMVEVMQMAMTTGALAKAGARNSAADAGILQKMHDMANSLGAMCKVESPVVEIVATKAEETGDLTKAADLAKMIEDAVAPLNKALLAAEIEIKLLKAQPMPSKGVLRVVSKENDQIVEVQKAEIKPVVERDGQVNSVATMLKSIHQAGGKPMLGM